MSLIIRRFALLMLALAYSSVGFLGVGINVGSLSLVSQQVQAESPQAIEAFNMGMRAFEKGQYDAAIQAFEQSLALTLLMAMLGTIWGLSTFGLKSMKPLGLRFKKPYGETLKTLNLVTTLHGALKI